MLMDRMSFDATGFPTRTGVSAESGSGSEGIASNDKCMGAMEAEKEEETLEISPRTFLAGVEKTESTRATGEVSKADAGRNFMGEGAVGVVGGDLPEYLALLEAVGARWLVRVAMYFF